MGRQNKGSRLVFSTQGDNNCSRCGRPLRKCGCEPETARSGSGDGTVRLHRETKGRGGKAVTLIRGLALPPAELKDLAKSLKQKCGVGGAIREDTIEIQGDQRPVIKAELEKRGFSVKIAGG